ncbi:MAG: LPS export ABC transporter permease LptG [Rhodospirillaceae bacterium]|nr:LPS export ABC transporter permease LptG [Rhodospirillaceae bacterium]
MTLGFATFDRYVMRHYLMWFAVTLAVLICVAFLMEFIEMLRRTADVDDVTLQTALLLSALAVPQPIELMFQFAVLFGAMLAFWRLTRSRELVVARASGISVWRFLFPVVFAALLIGIFKIAVYNPVSTAMYDRFQDMSAQYLGGEARIFLLSRNGLWFRQSQDGSTAIVRAQSIDVPTSTFNQAIVFLFDENGDFEGRLDSAQAVLEDGHWVFHDVTVGMINAPAEQWDRYTLPTNLTMASIQDSYADPRAQSVWELPQFIATLEDTGFSSLPHRLHLQSLLAQPLMMVSMVLYAAAFTLRYSRRGGTLLIVALGTLTSFAFFVLTDISYALGLAAAAPVALAAWSPPILSGLIGLALLLHLEDG